MPEPYITRDGAAAYQSDVTSRVKYSSRARWPQFGCPICGTGVWALRRHLKVWHGA